MPQFAPALISLTKLIAILDSDGVVRWKWFSDPLGEILKGIPANRLRLGEIIRALLDRDYPGTDQAYEGNTLIWEPINIGDDVQIGFVLTTDGDLRVGLGAKANFTIASQPLDVAALARLISISTGGNLAGEFGQARFTGTVPVPDFLKSAAISADYASPNLTVGLTVVDAEDRSRTLQYPNNVIAWDAARLATFVLQAWIHQQAAGGGFFQRVDDHLFPMLGDPEAPPNNPLIRSFPLVGNTMGQGFDINNWKNSVFSTDNGAAGALTFLWHLRALLTGNESPDFFSGSYFFPLISGASGSTPPTLADIVGPYDPGPSSVWFGITTDNGILSLVLDVYDSNGNPCPRITLATVQNGTLTRPTLGATEFNTIAGFLASYVPTAIGIGEISATQSNGKWRITLLKEELTSTGLTGFDGWYELQLYLEQDQPIAYKLKTPTFELDLPPVGNPADGGLIFATVFQWLLSALPAEETGTLGPVISQIADFVQKVIAGNADVDQLALDLIMTVAALVGPVVANATQLDIDPLYIEIAAGSIKPSIQLGPLKPGDLGNLPIHIGKIKLEGDLAISTSQCAVQSITLTITDLRFGEGGGAKQATGLLASLLPDLREAEGFQVSLKYILPDQVTVTGGGKIPIQRSIGPLDIVSLLVDIREDSLSVGIDLSFKLAMLTVSAYELGIQFPFDGSTPTPFLHGLGVGFDASGIKLVGMFAEVKQPGSTQGDYVGGAVVSIVNMFELSAIGGYTQINNEASLFIFGSLVAPLGGPPWFFVTGIAGGFGYNRSLPPPGLVADHPFMRVMRGEISANGPTTEVLQQLSQYFAATKGQHWIAAGIQFTCFGFINGKVVVAVAFGHKFSLNILGLASFGIKPLAYFELGLEATADEEKFLLKAGLSPNSYIIHPDIFSLRGDFALGVWHAAPNAGDFVLSIGGYHPYFKKPDHYPDLARVGCKAVVYNFVHLSVECFFACSPQALMAGAAVSLWAEFAGIGAGLDVYLDVFIRWDPFFLLARMGVTVWFEFFGRHEIGVDLEIHTPPFGGVATIDLALVSFDIAFGAEIDDQPWPLLHEFVSSQLGVPASLSDGLTHVDTFNAEDQAGLVRVDFLSGRTAKAELPDSAKQEGVDQPVSMAAEFSFSVRTRLPIKEGYVDANIQPPTTLSGEVDLPLCNKLDLTTELRVSAANISNSRRERVTDFFPAANFGDPLPSAQADDKGARQSVGDIDTSKASIALTEGTIFHYEALLDSPPSLTAKSQEDSLPDEEYPLPLGDPESGQVGFKFPKMTTLFSPAPLAVHFTPKAAIVGRRQAALAAMTQYSIPPLHIFSRAADGQRFSVPVKIKGLTVAAPPTDAVIMAPPPSPNRRAELFGVNLRIVPPKAPINLKKPRLETLSRARNLTTRYLTPPDGVTGSFRTDVGVQAGKAVHLDLSGGRIQRNVLTISGEQTVRAIYLGRADDVIADTYVTGGVQTVEVPRRARRLVLCGEGFEPPVSASTRTAVAQEAIGIEHDSVLLALGRNTFAAHGCVLETSTALSLSPRPLDSVPGFEVLRAATNFRIHFPAVDRLWSLLLAVRPIVDSPGSAVEEIRWASLDATLDSLTTVIGPQATAFVMPVTADRPWTLSIDLGKKWRLVSAVVCGHDTRELVPLLRSQSNWDFVDDRFTRPAVATTTNVTMEVG